MSDVGAPDDRPLLVERRGAVAWLTLHRPQQANAWSPAMQAALARELAAASADEALSAAVVTGSGRVFSGGADIEGAEGLSPVEAGNARAVVVRDFLLAAFDFPKPLVAAVNGPAVGAGCMLALVCDAVVAVDGAHFSLPEIDLDMPSPLGHAVVEMAADGALASDLLLTGRRMSAHEAQARGLAQCVTPESLAVVAQMRAEALGRKPRRAFALNKEWINTARRERVLAALDCATRFRARGAAATDTKGTT